MSTQNFTPLFDAISRMINSDAPHSRILDEIIRNTIAARGFQLTRSYLSVYGDGIFAGPFQGMRLGSDIMPPFLVSRYIGAYEHELAAVIEETVRQGYDSVLNIGCAEGYYAVGLALRMPSARIHAYDILSSAREKCRRLADLNGVLDRFEIGELFRPEDFARHTGKRCLVFCDIEGGEYELLDPQRAPTLADMDLIVEIHPNETSTTAEDFVRRFAATHEGTIIAPARAYTGPLPEWSLSLSELNIHLLSSSFRPFPTPWVSLRSRRAR